MCVEVSEYLLGARVFLHAASVLFYLLAQVAKYWNTFWDNNTFSIIQFRYKVNSVGY